MNLIRPVALLALCSLAVACSPSAKNEEQYWNNHQKDATEYSTRWPGFKQVLEAQKTQAQPVWDAALTLTDEKQKAVKMKEANEIYGKLVRRLGEVKYKSQGIESTLAKLNDLRLDRAKDSRRTEAVRLAYASLESVNASLTGARPASIDEAEGVLRPQISSLISAQGDLDRAFDALKPAKETTKKKK